MMHSTLFFESNDVHVTEHLFYECSYFLDRRTGAKSEINLETFSRKGMIKVEEMPISDITQEFGMKLIAYEINEVEMGDGEVEALSFIYGKRDFLLCTGDEKVFKFMAFMGLEENAVSLEELLGEIRGLPMRYSELIKTLGIKEGLELRESFLKNLT
ncbi:MAG: hypothetical protein PHW02_00240 [bacterium]|nr:hypothetical protein [bacterium]